MALPFAATASVAAGLSELMRQGAQSRGIADQAIEANRAIVQANLANSMRTALRVNIANAQLAQRRTQAVQQGADLIKSADQSYGQAAANQGASWASGSSAQAVLDDVRMRLGEAQGKELENWQTTLFNYNNALESLTQQGLDQVQNEVVADIPSAGKAFGNALLAGLVQFAGMYSNSKMSLGLGDSAASTQTAFAGAYGESPSVSSGMFSQNYTVRF